ncbi:pentatricopeptide repeat-containing protein [Tanacetum coccineum]
MGDQYGYIRSYAKAILESNDGSTVRKGCRRVIALDVCFLKKPNVGEILTTIGRDRNNHIFPVAWAVVNVEDKDNWSWFLELLGEDLDLPTRNGLTLISDQYKGLIEVVKDVMPHAEHRQCSFNKIMDKIKRANTNAYQYLLNKDLKTWSRAYFRTCTNCEAVENGFSECFNAFLLRVRNERLIIMLEAMRVNVMERMNTMRRMLDKWTYDICPNIQKRLELNKDQQSRLPTRSIYNIVSPVSDHFIPLVAHLLRKNSSALVPSVAYWLRISSGSVCRLVEIYHGRPLLQC